GGAGKLKLEVRPGDASVYVDGAFRGTGREASTLQLPAGRHRIEVVRPGYRTIERDVEVTPGETTDLSVDLEKSSS
ncbi:MAG: PEGA domain-containing protein, partial [Betaproteobacteria bacterium]